ncbi:DNA-binding transcriptional MerR regulator [Psychromicrobium silvestre]|uniref:DNA-binding transcriptional MerR regulator n=1 Tax=Psychromicrobium silvestre TaxID=1645614 RepID=A0A7Y9S807_9MICC|nr:MerR family transcriptional regulator [Psychromicrobium silvestre]NYE94987.1 DNA-binding transcriptional MerR regulator [Psychromicrobium silvestre]
MSATAWSISEVAKMTGVSSRTLRHYDQIDLLKPAWAAHNGYRYYQQPELLRLQRILLLRELGLSLEIIAQVLLGQRDELQALEVHHRWLLAERDRMSRLANTVEATMASLVEGQDYGKGKIMNAEAMFSGFEKNPYEKEAVQRWGKEAVARANASWSSTSPEERQAALAESTAINIELAACQQAGLPADDERVQAAVARHYRWITLSWTPNAESYLGLGQLYVDDDRFRANYEKAGASPEYLLEAIKVYAAKNL